MIGRRNAQDVGLEASVVICILYMAVFDTDSENMGSKTSSQNSQVQSVLPLPLVIFNRSTQVQIYIRFQMVCCICYYHLM